MLWICVVLSSECVNVLYHFTFCWGWSFFVHSLYLIVLVPSMSFSFSLTFSPLIEVTPDKDLGSTLEPVAFMNMLAWRWYTCLWAWNWMENAVNDILMSLNSRHNFLWMFALCLSVRTFLFPWFDHSFQVTHYYFLISSEIPLPTSSVIWLMPSSCRSPSLVIAAVRHLWDMWFAYTLGLVYTLGITRCINVIINKGGNGCISNLSLSRTLSNTRLMCERKTFTNIQDSDQNQYVYIIRSVSSKTTSHQNTSLLYFTTGF